MLWNRHSEIGEGMHSFLGGSRYSWLNYSDDQLIESYKNSLATARGTRLHEFAKDCIELGQRLPRKPKTLNMYVNDAIHYKMRPEQVIFYSIHAFGIADAISFEKKLLRIHDLKTGKIPASLHQLEIYAAYFCLEYDVKPGSIDYELRIYQNDDILIGNPTGANILPIMDKIKRFDKLIDRIQEEEFGNGDI